MHTMTLSDIVTQNGSPSGMNATATETQSMIRVEVEMKSGWSRRSHAAQAMTMMMTTVAARPPTVEFRPSSKSRAGHSRSSEPTH